MPQRADNVHDLYAGTALETISGLEFVGDPEDRAFLDGADLLPMRNVCLLGGDGGTGKSLLALQLAIAVTSATLWIGIAVQQGPVLYLSAEDDRIELHNRFHEVCRAEGIDKSVAGAGLEFAFMAGEDAVLANEDKRATKMVRTELCQKLDATMERVGPILLILDNLADVFSGNENNRSLVKQFVGMLRKLAIKHDCVVLLLGHPSLKGLQDDTGTSGSTAWNNSVRSRIYLRRVLDGERKVEKDETQRELQVMKSNYSAKGDPIQLKWKNGRFKRAPRPSLFDGTPSDIADRVKAEFSGCKYRADAQSPMWGGFKIAEMLGLDVGRGLATKYCTDEQKNVRKRVGQMLSAWVNSNTIRVVESPDGHGDTRPFYDA